MPKISICEQCSIKFSPGPGSKGIVCSYSCDAARKKITVSERAITRYLASPQYCQQCKDMLPYGKHGKNKKFCSSSCAATFNNTNRSRSDISRKITSDSLKKFFSENPYFASDKPINENGKRLRENICVNCDTVFLHTKLKKTCSDDCKKKHSSATQIAYLKKYAGTFNWIRKGKMNYVEQCFNDWLIEIGYTPMIDFVALANVIHNYEKNTSYIMDFWFPTLNLNIELDGTHHLRPEQQLRDTSRDEYLTRAHDIQVIRIIVKEWNNKRLRTIIKSNLENGALERSRTSMCPVTGSTL